MTYRKQAHYRLLKLVLLTICFFVTSAHSDIVVVVPATSPIKHLSKTQVAKIFLGKSRRFPDGTKALPLNQKEGNLERDAFYQLVSGKSPAQIKAHWSKLIFTGRGQPPKEAASNEVVKQLLINNAVNIGYIDRAAVDNSVKIVALK
jgi:ABC-type phosphate transport system substrate-binding protein